MRLIESVLNIFHTNCKKSKNRTIPSKPYRDRKYYVNNHCVKRMIERQINRGEVHYNLHTIPIEMTKVVYDKYGRPSYRRSSKNKITTAINPFNRYVLYSR